MLLGIVEVNLASSLGGNTHGRLLYPSSERRTCEGKKKRRPSVVRLQSGAVEEPSRALPAQKRFRSATSDGNGDGRSFSAGGGSTCRAL
jgi:hypothetical protein